jgi:hypothetical protein
MKINFVESSPIPVKAARVMGKIHEVYRLLVNISEEHARVASVVSSLSLMPGNKGTKASHVAG